VIFQTFSGMPFARRDRLWNGLWRWIGVRPKDEMKKLPVIFQT
jgi:hypothetical protein